MRRTLQPSPTTTPRLHARDTRVSCMLIQHVGLRRCIQLAWQSGRGRLRSYCHQHHHFTNIKRPRRGDNNSTPDLLLRLSSTPSASRRRHRKTAAFLNMNDLSHQTSAGVARLRRAISDQMPREDQHRQSQCEPSQRRQGIDAGSAMSRDSMRGAGRCWHSSMVHSHKHLQADLLRCARLHSRPRVLESRVAILSFDRLPLRT